MKSFLTFALLFFIIGAYAQDEALRYVDSRVLYQIEVPTSFIPHQKFHESEELTLLLESKKNDEPSFLILRTTEHEGTLAQYLLVQKMLLIKDNANSNIQTKEAVYSKYKGEEVHYDRKGKNHIKCKVVYIKTKDHVLEFLFLGHKKNFKKQEKLVTQVINSLKVFEQNCTNPTIAKEGRFVTKKDSDGSYILRTNSTHTEYFDDKGSYVKSEVKWIDDCELHLFFIESNPKDLTPFTKDDVLKIKILNTGEDWYDCIWEIKGQKGYEKYFKTN